MNAHRAVQRALALGILAVLVAAAILILILLVNIILAKAINIEDMREELFRLNQIIARRPQNIQPSGSEMALFLEGNTLPLIQANLQQRVNVAASTSGATIASISGTSLVRMDGASYVGVRADIQGRLHAFHDVIHNLETSSPPLIIKRAVLRSTNTISRGELLDPLQLAGQIMVYGAISPSVGVPEEGRR